MTDLDFLKLSKPQKLLHQIGAFFASVPGRLLGMIKGLGKWIARLVIGTGKWFSGLVTTFVRSITAISAVILLVTPRFLLITCRINEYAEKGEYGVACAYATILILITYAAILIMNTVLNHFGTSKKIKEEVK